MSASVPFEDVLAALLHARDQGEEKDLDAWTARYPDHADALRAHFAAEDWFSEAAAPIRESTGHATPERPITPPVVAGYTILSEVARGGMGVVFEAEQHEPHRVVALKTLRDAVLATDEDVRRFRREAQAMAELDHPGIVRVLALGEAEGRLYFTMPLAAGGSLAENMHAFVGAYRRSARLVRDVARAVAHGHARGILHRDLKPGNVLLDEQDHPLVADFGLARRASASDADRTRSGTVLGSPAWMAPEQARGDIRAIDERTDVWSLGAIFYQLLTGRPPFVGTGPADTIALVLHASPRPIRTAAPGVPRSLAAICEQCLRKSPADRYASMRDLADDLERALAGQAIRARGESRLQRARQWVRRHPAIVGMALLSVLALGALLSARRSAQRGNSEARLRRASEALATARRLSDQGDVVGAGLYFAAADALAPSWEARRGLAAHATPVPLRVEPPTGTTLWRVRFAAGGRVLAACGSDGNVHLWDGSAHVGTLAHNGRTVRGLAFDRSGRRLATGAEDGVVRVWDVATRKELARIAVGEAAGPVSVPAIVWLDDAQVAFGGDDGAVHVWVVGAPEAQSYPAANPGGRVASLASSPDGRTLVVGQAHLSAEVRAVQMLAATGEMIGRGQVHAGAVWDCAWRPDGTQFATADDTSVRIWDAHGFRLLHRLKHDQAVGALAFSADGTRLVTATTGGAVRTFDTATGIEIGRARLHGGAVYGVDVHPGTGAVATVGLEGILRIWPAASSSARRYVTRDATGQRVLAAPARDGRRVLMFADEGGGRGTLELRSRGGREVVSGLPFENLNAASACRDLAADGEGWLALADGAQHAGDARSLQVASARLRDGRLAVRRGSATDAGARVLSATIHPTQGLVLALLPDALRVFRIGPDLGLSLVRHVPQTRTACVSPSGDVLARIAESDAHRITVERSAEGGAAFTRTVEDAVGQLAVTDDASRVALALRDRRRILVYDVRAGRVLATVRQREVYAMRFAAGGRILLTASADGAVRAWGARSGSPVGRMPAPHEADAASGASRLRLAPGGDWLLTVGWTGGVVSWNVAWMAATAPDAVWARRRRAAELSAMRRIGDDGEILPLDLSTWRSWRQALGD